MPLNGPVTIRIASGNIFSIIGTINLAVQIGTSQATVNFLVAKQLDTEVILGCDYCDYITSILCEFVPTNDRYEMLSEMPTGIIWKHVSR